MNKIAMFTRAVSVSALVACSVPSAYADPGKADRARTAIAEARAKIEAGDKIGANVEAPELQGRARAALDTAEGLLSHGKKDDAIAEARHAGEFADLAIVSTDKHKESAAVNGRIDAEVSAAQAQQAAADANGRADAAQQVAAAQTDAANARADAAQQAAIAANAQAEALRNAPPATATVATVEKKVTVTPVVRRTSHRVVHRTVRKARPVATGTTTTTTTTLTTK